MLGFLRESQVIADKTGLDKDTNICRTGLCIDGIKRMAKEYRKFPEQYKINIQYLKNNDKENKTYWRLLEAFYNDEDYLLNNHT